ncbi:unnamed protein product [Mytilus coruscus]|uniref:DUF5641 domain-containing protein n=1 Tax=Mytilus coruscus TaxID=42192 RepID=A0A6J8C561_MYTCO|nr:unnamed protein product [Mytilus coruscus]
MLLTHKIGQDTVSFPTIGSKDMLKSQRKHTQVLAEKFWNRWRNEYLNRLKTRRKWTHECAQGYRPEEKHSVKDLQWSKGLHIHHTRNGGEKTIDQYRVDGYYKNHDGENIVGFFCHGYSKCWSQHTINTVNKLSMAGLYDFTMEKEIHIVKEGYEYSCILECEFDINIREDKNIKILLILSKLSPYWSQEMLLQAGEQRHSHFITNLQWLNLSNTMITCTGLKQQSTRHHNNEERSFIGTWVKDEFNMAGQKGYAVDSLHEVWHSDEIEQYNPRSKSRGIFTEYIKTFLKMKQEASGWPSWCITKEHTDIYSRLF